jgi:hypothetical protein
MKQEIRLHQALYGYHERKGHCLLTSSLKISREHDRFFQITSDHSAMGKKFEPFITVLPIPKSNSHFIAKTWAASEMPRPGCVWTHIIFLDHPTLAVINNLGNLLSLFKRPELDEKKHLSSKYDQPVQIDVFSPIQEADANLATTLYQELYTQDSPILMGLPVSIERAEGTVFSIWSQQWPRLRRSFGFVVGTTQPKRGNFDLQICREINTPIPLLAKNPDWIKEALKDLFDDKKHLLRDFMNTFGADITTHRSIFAILVTIWGIIDGDLHKVTQVISDAFSSVTEAKRLKLFVLSASDEYANEVDKLDVIIHLKQTSMWSRTELEVQKRAEALWQLNQSDATKLTIKALKQVHQEFANDFLAGTVGQQNIDLLAEIARVEPQALETMMEMFPRLQTSPLLWKAIGENASGLARTILMRLKPSNPAWSSTIQAILDAHVEKIAQFVIKRFGSVAIDELLTHPNLLRWVDENWFKEWISACQNTSSQILELLKTNVHQQSLVFAALILEPIDHEVVDAQFWQKLTSSHLKALSNEQRLRVRAFLFGIGLQLENQQGKQLIQENVLDLHQAQAQNNLPTQAWDLFAPLLPRNENDWDRCERIRLSVHQRGLQVEWSQNSNN